MRNRAKPFMSPLAARYAREMNTLSWTYFRKPCKKLSKKECRQFCRIFRDKHPSLFSKRPPQLHTSLGNSAVSVPTLPPDGHQGLTQSSCPVASASAPPSPPTALPPPTPPPPSAAPKLPPPQPAAQKPPAAQPRLTGWDGIKFGKQEPPTWAIKPVTRTKAAKRQVSSAKRTKRRKSIRRR